MAPPPPPRPPGPRAALREERLAREAAALRENLRKRKQQARARAAQAQAPAEADRTRTRTRTRRPAQMPVMPDRWIRRMAAEHGMIEPFVETPAARRRDLLRAVLLRL